MTDIVEKLRGYARDDHERGCQGREYHCSCGYDGKRDTLLVEAADEIERLRGELADAETDAAHDRQQIRENAASITALQAEIERLRAALNARCPVDAIDRGMSPVEAAVYHVWGERCPDFEPECLTCRAWAEYDDNAKLRAALERIDRMEAWKTQDSWDVLWAKIGIMRDIARAVLGGEND